MEDEHNNKNQSSALEKSLIAKKILFESEKMQTAMSAASIMAKHLKNQEELMKKLTDPFGFNNNHDTPRLCIDDIIPKDYTLASYKYETLIEEINAFQSKLSDDLDVMIKLVSFGENMLLLIDTIDYQNPDILFFYGRNSDGNPVELIQHMSQLSFLLLAVKRTNMSVAPHRIGFLSNRDEEK